MKVSVFWEIRKEGPGVGGTGGWVDSKQRC